MGKKSFVENYDPLGSQLRRDAERVREAVPAPLPEPKVVPQAVPPARPVVVPKAPVAPEPRRREEPEPTVTGEVVPRERQKEKLLEDEFSARIKVPHSVLHELEKLLSTLYRKTGSRIHYSMVTRSLWGLVLQAGREVTEELARVGLGRLPSTKDVVAYAAYEEKIRVALGKAIRRMSAAAIRGEGVDEGEQDTAE